MTKKSQKLAMLIGAMGATVALASCSGGAGASGGDGEPITARLSSYLSQTSSMGEAFDKWADMTEECAAGDIVFERFHDGALFGAMDTRDAVGAGRAEVGAFSAGYHAGEFPLTDGLFIVPFVSGNVLAVKEGMQEVYETTPEAQAEWNDQGLELLTMVPVTPTPFSTNVDVKKIEDLKGLNMRGYPAGGLNAGLKFAGANPVDMALADLPESMQRGVIDGYGGVAMDVSVSMSLHESVSNFVEAGFGTTGAAVLAVNKKWWDGLPDNVRTCGSQAADDLGEQYLEIIEKVEGEACEVLAANGNKISVLPESEMNRLKDAVQQDQRDVWLEQAEGFIDDPNAYLEKYEQAVHDAEAANPGLTFGVEGCL